MNPMPKIKRDVGSGTGVRLPLKEVLYGPVPALNWLNVSAGLNWKERFNSPAGAEKKLERSGFVPE